MNVPLNDLSTSPFSDIKLEVGTKFWIKGPNSFTLGKGDVKLIKALLEMENLTKASGSVGYSYKYGWQKLKNITKRTGHAVVESHKGGHGGGGTVKVTDWGRYLIFLYDSVEKKMHDFQKEQQEWIQQQDPNSPH